MTLIGLMERFDMQTSAHMKLQQTFQLPLSVSVANLDVLRRESIKREEEQRRVERTEGFLKAVPARFYGKTEDDFHLDYPEQERCKKIALNFVLTFPQRLKEGTCLKFLGNSGTGKTLLSLIIYQALAKTGFSVRYESSLHFLRQFQEKEFESHTAYQSLLGSYLRIQFLVIDEVSVGIGKGGHPSDWQRSHLYTLINQRYINRLCTLIISNHSQDELVERLGEPTVGRLTENGITLAFNWKSYRQK